MAAPPGGTINGSSSSSSSLSSSSSSLSSSSSSSSQSSLSSSSVAPKILLAKPLSSAADSTSALRSRLPSVGSLNLLSDSWDFHTERILPFLTENTDFTVIGVIGTPGAGKSTIFNELYGFDGSSPGMLPPFATQSEETRATARHCTTGIELRISAERLILLDTQPIFSPSVLGEMMRPDGSSTISLSNGEALSADLAHELMCIRLGVFLASVCHVLLVVTEGIHDISMWHHMLTVDLLKHRIPDPSSLTSSYTQVSNPGPEKDNKDYAQEAVEEYLAAPVFVHTKLRDEDLSPIRIVRLKKRLLKYFSSSSFMGVINRRIPKDKLAEHPDTSTSVSDLAELDLFVLPHRCEDDSRGAHYESYATSLGKLRDKVLAMNCQPFAKTVSEREWLKNSARIWEIVKNSPIIAEYSKTLQDSGMFRR